MDATKRQARIAGFLYLLLAVSAPFGLLVVPGAVFVPGDATATAAKLLASEWLVRVGIASEMFHQAVQVFLLLALYRLFQPVSDMLAKLLVALGALVSVPVVFVNVLNELAALFLVNGTIPAGFDKPQLDALAYLFFSLHEQGIIVVETFWGLWLFPFGLLVIRSGFIPKAYGYLLIIAGTGYVGESFGTILLPQYAAAIKSVTGILVIAEIPIVFWLVIWGARASKATASA